MLTSVSLLLILRIFGNFIHTHTKIETSPELLKVFSFLNQIHDIFSFCQGKNVGNMKGYKKQFEWTIQIRSQLVNA